MLFSLPIFQLQLSGYCSSATDSLTCGAIQTSSEEDKVIQNAASTLKAVPILWYRKVRKTTASSPHRKKNEVKKVDAQGFGLSPTSTVQQNDDLFKVQRKLSFSYQMSKVEEKISKKMFEIDKEKEEDESNDDEEETMYAAIEGTMSVCDTDTGPALEIKTFGIQVSLFRSEYEILDYNPSYDVMSSFVLEGGEDSIQRTIPLNMICNASPGGHWNWKNIMNLSGGNCNCSVKIYGKAPANSFVKKGKKICMFDIVSNREATHAENRDKIIDAINIMLLWDKKEAKLETQAAKEAKASRKIESYVEKTLCC